MSEQTVSIQWCRGARVTNGLGSSGPTQIPEGDSTGTRLVAAYLDHVCSRLLNTMVISSPNDMGSYRDLLELIVRFVFKIEMGASECVAAGEHPIVHLALESRHIRVDPRSASKLSCEGVRLGQNFVLGKEIAEVVPCFRIRIGLTLSRFLAMRNNPHLPIWLERVFDRLIPLHLDYRTEFFVQSDDLTFRIRDARDTAPGRAPILGITSALGAD